MMDTSYTTNTDMAISAAALATFFIVTLVLVAVAYVVMALLLGRIFKKAGIESWKAWVPFYNNWTLLEMGGQQGFWAVLAIVPFINIVSIIMMYIAMYNIGLKLGKEGVFILWAVFLPIVWYIWLAFDNSTWNGTVPVATQPVMTQPEKNDDHPTEIK